MRTFGWLSLRSLLFPSLVLWLILALIVDVFYVPLLNLALVYCIPVLIAALFLTPPQVTLIATIAVIGDVTDLVLDRNSAFVIATTTGAIVIVGLLAILLARERQIARQHARDAEQARSSLQEFLAMVVHDLRNPLGVNFGYADLLQRRLAEHGAPESDLQVARRIGESARDMRRLVEDLAVASALGRGEFTIHPEPMDLIDVVARIVEQYRERARGHDLTIDAPPHVEGTWDKDRIAQVLTNLVSNAIKYAPPGPVRVVVRRDTQRVICRVEDRGVPLTPEQIAALFRPFSRLDQTKVGMGLGLYISRGIVEAHGGRLWAEPSDQGGNCFAFDLPA